MSDDIGELATSWGMSGTAPTTVGLAPALEALQSVMDRIDDLPSPPAPAVDGRDWRGAADATTHADPCNAVVRWCDVHATTSGPLAGLRVALKDCMALAGIPMTAGSALLRGFVPDRDSVVARRLLEAGARIVAITNMDELAASPGGDSSCYGATRNPRDESRTAGGSSGGSAAVLAYDDVDVALGTDTGGSIRIPASWCGVLGLKPTHGLIAHTGVMGADHSIDHVGPLATNATDLAAVMQVLAGVDGTDPRQPASLPEIDFVGAAASADPTLGGVRIGVVEEGLSADLGVAPDVVAAFEDSMGRLESLGAQVDRVALPEHLAAGVIGFNLFAESFASLLRAGGCAFGWDEPHWPELAAALRAGFAAHADEMSPQLQTALLLGARRARRSAGEHYAKAGNLRTHLRCAYDAALDGRDFLAMPTTPSMPHEVIADLDPSARVLRSFALVVNTAPTDLTGHPALSMPLGRVGPLPLGVMVVARRLDDARLVSLAATVEQAIGWS